jgi:hypothetical protein
MAAGTAKAAKRAGAAFMMPKLAGPGIVARTVRIGLIHLGFISRRLIASGTG